MAARPSALSRFLYSPLGLKFLVTGRGIAFLALATVLLRLLVAPRNDLVAAELSFITLAVVLILVTITALVGTRNSRAAVMELRGDPTATSGGAATTLVLEVERTTVPPFYTLSLAFELKNAGAEIPVFRLSGSSFDKRLHPTSIKFPHRGQWELSKIHASFGDQFGLTAYHWERTPTESTFYVRPGVFVDRTLPVVSSAQRSGDDLIDTRERLGDPFDLKQYHPSDGMKRILWKVYAKSGELISRHPEPSMTPEGQVVLYVAAGRADDSLCALTVTYLTQLETLGLDSYIGCSGMGGNSPARTPDDAEELLISSVWESDHRNPEVLERELTTLLTSVPNTGDSQIRKLLVFLSPKSLATPADTTYFLNLGVALETRGVQPVYFLVDATQGGPAPGDPRSEISRLPRWIRRFLYIESPEAPVRDPVPYQSFISGCLSKQWEVVL